MKTIYKYQLTITDKQTIKLPLGFKILSIQQQNYELTIWALVDPSEKEKVNSTFYIFGTGHEIYSEQDLEYISTVQMINRLVWHVFLMR